MPIREKYELETKPIAIGGEKLEIYTIKAWDTVIANLEEKGEAYIEKFPFWIRVWEASFVLADHLIQMGIEKESEILEIGAGMGITGLFLGAFGHKVTVTDCQEDALELLRLNVQHNKLNNVSVTKLDWKNPNLTGKYDVICGSELIYNEASIGPIINLFQKYLQPDGTVFLAHDSSRMCVMKFIGMVPGRFEIENISKTLRGNDSLDKVIIHKLHLR